MSGSNAPGQVQYPDFTEVSIPPDDAKREYTRAHLSAPPQPREVQNPTPRQAAKSWLETAQTARSGFSIV